MKTSPGSSGSARAEVTSHDPVRNSERSDRLRRAGEPRLSGAEPRALLLAATLVVASLRGFADPTNLLSNGSFESGTLSGWTANGAAASTNRTHSGTWSARCTSQSMRATVSTIPGETFKVTGWVKIDAETGNTNGWGGARIEAYDTSGSAWKTLAHSGWLRAATRGTNWLKLAMTFTATANSTPLDVGYFGDPARAMVVYFDDLMVFRKPASNALPSVTAAVTPTNLTGLPQTQDFSVTADDPDGAIQRIDWNFGDGAKSQAFAGRRRVGVPGRYLATERVSDDDDGVVTRTLDWTADDDAFPRLTVLQPAQLAITSSVPTLTLNGTASGAGVAVTVSSDRDFVAPADGASAWSLSVSLRPGWNRLLVQARDAEGRVITEERRVRHVPNGPLGVVDLVGSATRVERWERLIVTFRLTNSAATHTQFPFDPNPPPGMAWLDGVSVDALFTPDDGRTVYRRPGFLNQPYERALKGGEEWLYPTNEALWTVRFAPPKIGQWQYRIAVVEARGEAQSEERRFDVTLPTDPLNHGPIRVAPADARYFECGDGTTFLGNGHNLGFSEEQFSFDAEAQFNAMGSGNQQFFRWWIAGKLWGSAWQPWNSRTLGYDGTVPKTGLSLASAYADGLTALRIDAANPIMFQGWMSGHAGLVPGRSYLVRVRWRTESITGPVTSGQPFGVCLKLTGWPEPGQTGALPALVPHVHGDTPWHVATGTFVADRDLLQNLAIILENASDGTAYVDEVALHEVLPNSALGPQLLRSPRFNSHFWFDPRPAAGMEAILDAAVRHGMAFKLNVSEKQEELMNRLGPDGLPDPLGGNFNRGPGTPTHRLHEYYWRHLFARFGASRAVHSWELVNEEDPNNLEHFRLAADLARAAADDGNPHPATTSTWSSFATNSWKNPASAPLGYADFHAYVRSTGELQPREELANDSARFFHDYDLAALGQGFGKPVVWGEMGIDGANGSDSQDPLLAQDTTGVWLHKIVWARTGPGGVYPLYWYTDQIRNHSLHWRYGNWSRFMSGIPLHNGRYIDAGAASANPDLRGFGQKDLVAGRAHLWIDNRFHTWRAVVAASNIPPISATVTVTLGAANADYIASWYGTTNGLVAGSETRRADGAGVVTLAVTNLTTDIAVRLERIAGPLLLPRIIRIEPLPEGIYLRWDAEAGRRYRVNVTEQFAPPDWSALLGDVEPIGLWGEKLDPLPGPSPTRFYRLEMW
jgi:hypothetical protein